MENQLVGLKEIVAQQPYIAVKPMFFGLFKRYAYAPSMSRLEFEDRFYAPVLREELKELFALNDADLAKRLAKMQPYEQVVNGNMLVECCFSEDKEFAAIRLMKYEQIDYQPASEVRFLQGDTAHQAAKVFAL